MEYIRYTTEFKLECLRKYFTPPMKPVRVIALETGAPFSTLAEWVTKARKAGILAWLFESSRKLPTERPKPWSEDVPETCKVFNG